MRLMGIIHRCRIHSRCYCRNRRSKEAESESAGRVVTAAVSKAAASATAAQDQDDPDEAVVSKTTSTAIAAASAVVSITSASTVCCSQITHVCYPPILDYSLYYASWENEFHISADILKNSIQIQSTVSPGPVGIGQGGAAGSTKNQKIF